ncbi:hypothetical protein IBE33_09390 [Francisella philomiragia]|uniref:Uncharacterized protein n=1 Tax=Francisella tularensis subsp. novicida PA10-7858 TaxID=1386968 RepID=V5TAF2_FRANO|nr:MULTISPECIES: hypothetical protein [Francisella]AHB60784.1 hypothetical protein N894_0016 [Francisella tularensis subsp. novicida PA10-7858]MBK2341723.1 hypothetical protein [Francisella philomiragia]
MQNLLISLIILLGPIQIFATEVNNIEKIPASEFKEALYEIEETKISLEEAKIQAENTCRQDSFGFNMDYPGFEAINNAMGSGNNIGCIRKQRIEEQIQRLDVRKQKLLLAMKLYQGN